MRISKPSKKYGISAAPSQAKDDKSPGAYNLVRFVALHWDDMMLSTMKSALSPDHLADLGALDDPDFDILTTHFKFMVSCVKQFSEFALLSKSFPWRFQLLCDPSSEVVAATLQAMKEEWAFLLEVEKNPRLHQKYPLNLMSQLRWFIYREVMTFAEEAGWKATDALVDLAKAWFSDPQSTLGCEECFRQVRAAESRHATSKEASPEKIQAVCIKSINARYADFELTNVESSDYHGIRPGMFMKRSVFDCSKASATDTGLSNFNQIMKASTISPHHLSRKSLNMWQAYKATGGNTQHWWTAQLMRSGQATLGL